MGRFIKFGLVLLTMKKLWILFVVLFFVQTACAAHYISGWVNDALDGESADGKSVILWNPSVGIMDNLTDIVGPTGNSGTNSVYFIDCEALSSGCLIDSILSLKIFGERYLSWIVNVTVTGAGYDLVDNLSLNSPPTASLIFPLDSGVTDSSVDFNCSFFDYDDNLERVSLWGNWSGSWVEEDFITSGFENGYFVFSEVLVQGNYKWNCYVEDEFGVGGFDISNNSFFVDTTPPNVWDVTSVTDVCGFGAVPVECSVSDNFEVGSVIIRTTSPAGILTNYSAQFISENVYRANVGLDEAGSWGFDCLANDSVGNWNYSVGENVSVGSMNPEISFYGGVEFSGSPSVEGEVLQFSVNVTNFGCVGSGNFVVGFFDDGINFQNETVFIGVDSYEIVVGNWVVDIGSSNISVFADLEDVLDEDNESNNLVSGFAYLKAWQGIYGNVSLDVSLAGGSQQMGYWSGVDSFAGNVFVTDSEASVEWNSLQAVGRTKLGGLSSGDFIEIDSLLGMSSYNDSINNIYSGAEVSSFNVFGGDIENVSVVDSDLNGNFVTGILWDMSDSVDSEYDFGEKEDVVFVAKVNRGVGGSYGVYDYEISVPSKLRSYDTIDEERVYLYYDLK
jgi:hypothetical protein